MNRSHRHSHYPSPSPCALQAVRFAWNACDLDEDGYLDDAEFFIAHHLLWRWFLGAEFPNPLPAELAPKSKRELALFREIPFRIVHRVFISYRWDSPNAKGMAILVRDALKHLRYDYVFLDIDNLSGDVVS